MKSFKGLLGTTGAGAGNSSGKLEPMDIRDGGGYGARPDTAAATASRPTSSWGFAVRTPNPELPLSGGAAQAAMAQQQQQQPSAAGMTRPHTAHATVSRPGATPAIDSRQQQLQQKPGIAEPMEEDGDAHVVAGARAMMRYRRTRASTADGSVSKSWSSGVDGPQQAQQQQQQQQQQPLPPRVTIYQNPSKSGGVPQQMGTTMSGAAGGVGGPGGAPNSAAASSGFLGSGWMGGDRPKSAGITTSGFQRELIITILLLLIIIIIININIIIIINFTTTIIFTIPNK